MDSRKDNGNITDVTADGRPATTGIPVTVGSPNNSTSIKRDTNSSRVFVVIREKLVITAKTVAKIQKEVKSSFF